MEIIKNTKHGQLIILLDKDIYTNIIKEEAVEARRKFEKTLA